MKKILLISVLTSLLFITSYAQDNKPEANSFGMQYGVNFNGTIGQAIQFSGWIKHVIEIRGAMTFSYVNNQSTTVTLNDNGAWSGSHYIPVTQTTTSSSASLTVLPSVSIVKHIPIKGNLDFFIGGSVAAGVSTPTAWSKNSNTGIADSFYSYTSTNIKNPPTITWGMSLVGGANYFFYKNLAIGADFGVGFSASNTNGIYQEQDQAVSSGKYNQNTTRSNYYINYSGKITSNKYSTSFAGNAGLHLTYYVKVKAKAQIPPPNPKF